MEALSRDCPIPVFSPRYGQEWISFHGDFETVPDEAMDFFDNFDYPLRTGKDGVLFDMDWSTKPVWANPVKHWRPFIPKRGSETLSEDPLSFLFEPAVVPTIVHLLDGKGGEDFTVFTLDDTFRSNVEKFAKILSETCSAMGGYKSFYGPQSDYQGGPYPLWYRPASVNTVFDDTKSAQGAAASARRGILDMLGFVTWYQLVAPMWGGWRSESDRVFVQRLLVEARPKVGVLLSPARDHLFMNFPFLMKHNVPTHIIWREAERNSLRFVRFSPRFLQEFADAKGRLPEGQLVDPANLPSYYLWQPSLDRYDVYLVDSLMGRNGAPSTGFDPKAFHAMVDWPEWGRRWIIDREEIRSYSELYHCSSAMHDSGRFITFFRQEPRLQPDGYPRPIPPKERVDLGRFGSENLKVSDVSEGTFYGESPMIVRELYKTRCAPTKDKKYNTFNGRRVGPNQPRQDAPPYDRNWSVYEGNAHPQSTASVPEPPRRRLADRLSSPAGGSEPGRHGDNRGRRRYSRSVSPGRQESKRARRSPSLTQECIPDMEDPLDFNLEYQSGSYRSSDENVRDSNSFDEGYGENADVYSNSQPEFPIDPGSSSHEEYATPIPEEELYSEALRKLSDVIIGGEPCVALPEGATWSELWLSKAILVFHSKEVQIRVRTFANLRSDVENVVDVLNLMIRYGLPLTLYLKEEDIKIFRRPHLSVRELGLVAASYEPGHVESPLQDLGSPESTYGAYTSRLDGIFARAHTPSFIAEGGMLSWIAQLYAPDLVARFMEGPSIRVTEFRRGQYMNGRRRGAPGETFTRDCISPDEKELLYGRISNAKDSSRTKYLWPPQWLLEESSVHFHGIMNAGCQALFDNIVEDLKKG
ncbi:hypothetical protein C8J57DRAFT_1512572 [Mycena rebaudengoi]|nr:hypothetical protein C8J57DRAFT_1512572 [Mycena rebaudengoi]